MLLPQKVNIGPDRKIDVLHGRLAPEMLDDDKPILSRARIGVYQAKATDAINEYKLDKAQKHEHGLEACADCYLQAYAEEFEDRVYLRVYPEVVGMAENSAHFRGRAHLFMS
jgi:formate-dependent nitrite reductase cytochrome c552 subunit